MPRAFVGDKIQGTALVIFAPSAQLLIFWNNPFTSSAESLVAIVDPPLDRQGN